MTSSERRAHDEMVTLCASLIVALQAKAARYLTEYDVAEINAHYNKP